MYGYLDDILVMGRSFAEHISNLQEVFNRLRDANLCLKPSTSDALVQKCRH